MERGYKFFLGKTEAEMKCTMGLHHFHLLCPKGILCGACELAFLLSVLQLLRSENSCYVE